MKAYEIILLIVLAVFLVWMETSPAHSACVLSHCKDKAPTRSSVTNIHRQKVIDLYNPGHGRRIQIRNTDRKIVGYIERSGRITNTHRQKIGEVND